MIVKQKNLRVFHINIKKEDNFLSYIRKNQIILKEFFLLLEGEVSSEILSFLDNTSVCYKFINGYNLKLSSVKKDMVEEKSVKSKEEPKNLLSEEKIKKEIVFNRPIRSGEEINENTNITVFGRINSGAKLFSTTNVTIYGIIDGLVQCDGEYIVLKGISNRGNLIFNGEIIDKGILKNDVLQKIILNNGKLDIREV